MILVLMCDMENVLLAQLHIDFNYIGDWHRFGKRTIKFNILYNLRHVFKNNARKMNFVVVGRMVFIAVVKLLKIYRIYFRNTMS